MTAPAVPRDETDGTSRDEMLTVLERQRHACLADGPARVELRRDRIDRLVSLLTSSAEDLADALHADFGHRPRLVSQVSDIVGILPDLALTRARLRAWMRPRRVPLLRLLGVGTVVERIPLGVVGIIGPWNFPVSLVAQPTASAFAGGNRVIVKMSEVTPRTAEVFERAVSQWFEPEELTVITGGQEVGAAFASLPFDHLFFTGSPRVGSLVAQAAAENLVPTTLELGGKNPAVVAAGADVGEVASRIMAARLVNGGQVCLCPDDVFVPAQALAAFIDVALATAAKAIHADGGIVTAVDDRNFDRVTSLIDDARTAGATVHEADPGLQPDREHRRIPPVVITGVSDAMRIAREEVFGPVLTVYTYERIEEVLAVTERRPSPLAAYWYGPEDDQFERFTARIRCGGITVNDFGIHCSIMVAPFGGVGGSGWGEYHGRSGFETFTHARTITRSHLPISLAQLVTPPYGRMLTRAVPGVIASARWQADRRLRRSGQSTFAGPNRGGGR